MTYKPPLPLESLITALKVLPNVGAKSAQRMAFHLLQRNRAGAERLAATLRKALDTITHCSECNTFSETPVCGLCADTERDKTVLCVVEMPADVMMLEQAKCHTGTYFVLMGCVSPNDNIGVEDIAVTQLLTYLQHHAVEEVIIATNFTAEGELTAHILLSLLTPLNIKISRIARGMPMGGELAFVDIGTLSQAMYERRPCYNNAIPEH